MGWGRVKSQPDAGGAPASFPPVSSGLPEDGAMNISAAPPTSADKDRRVPLDKIDIRSAPAAAALGRIPAEGPGRHAQAPIFNSAL